MDTMYAGDGVSEYPEPQPSMPFQATIGAGKVREMWDKGIKSTRVEREQAAVNAQFIRNRHWVYFNRSSGRLEEVPRNAGRVRATVARIGPDSRRIIAKIMRRPLVFQIRPDAPDDVTMRASKIGRAALDQTHDKQRWQAKRLDHANSTWGDGVGALCVEWDPAAGRSVTDSETGQQFKTGDVRVTVVSLHEMAFEPGVREGESARWWIHGVALPPSEVQDMFGLEREPQADARAVDMVHRLHGEHGQHTPLTMVYTYFERPSNDSEGQVLKVVGDQIVEQSEWYFPFDDKLNIALAVVEPIHGRWYGHTPVTDAVQVQALYNASWSSIIEHMKLAGNARLWVPTGSVEDIEELSDTPGEAVEYNVINGARPGYESPPSMPDWWIRQPAMLERAMDDILSIHDVSRGEAPTGVESGVALGILSENDDTPVGAFAQQLGDCWARAATMVLELYEFFVQDSREASVQLGANIPEVISWTGGDLRGQTTVTVSADSVVPRSRAAVQAWAMNMYDRGFITTPQQFAKLADLPDADDMLAGIDPDTARAQRENFHLAVGTARIVDDTDDHQNHIMVHRDFMRSERFEYLDDEIQQMFGLHMQAHEMFAAQQMAAQIEAATANPAAAMLPSTATQVMAVDNMEQAAMMQQMGEAAVADGTGAPFPDDPNMEA